jgi:hypothetical protein
MRRVSSSCSITAARVARCDGEAVSSKDNTAINYRVEPISAAEAKAFIRSFESLGAVGHPVARYGARTPQGELAAVALFGRPAMTVSSDIIVLERGASAPWAHPHTASWFIPRACAMAARDHGWSIFYAYADVDAGELGVVYQACNWLYVGQTPDRLLNGEPRKRDLFRRRSDGKVVSGRTFYRADYDVADWERIQVPAKHKYVWIEAATKSERTKLRRLFKPLPYPKGGRLSVHFSVYQMRFPPRLCTYCNKPFLASRADAMTCSQSCRTMLSRRKREAGNGGGKAVRSEQA